MDYVYQRAGGGSGFAADWQSIKETINAPYVLQVKPFQGDGLSFNNTFEHVTRNVKFDGKDYALEGRTADRNFTSSVQRLDERTLTLTEKLNGKATATQEIRLSNDLKTLTITVQTPGRDKPTVLVFNRK